MSFSHANESARENEIDRLLLHQTIPESDFKLQTQNSNNSYRINFAQPLDMKMDFVDMHFLPKAINNRAAYYFVFR
jgi:hypothetical protein